MHGDSSKLAQEKNRKEVSKASKMAKASSLPFLMGKREKIQSPAMV